MTKTHENVTVVWNSILWRKLEIRIWKLQKRIFRASQRGDTEAVRRLQKTLMRSWSGKCIAVRKVTQDNKGKKTAGVDGFKSLSPKQRLTLVNQLKVTGKSKPTRRVWIDKPGKAEKRPLGIPTMYDRALQSLVKLALEPEWEARFEPNSYGFRPGRSALDAVEAIFVNVRAKAKFVLDADIAQCFDRIDHQSLLSKLNTFPTLRRQIKAWLKSALIKELNSKIKGWCNYYSTVVSKVTFSKCHNLTFQKLRAWSRRRCPKSNAHDIAAKYWRTVGENRWEFATANGHRMLKHSEIPIVRHVKVQDSRSPFDGDTVYWSQRMSNYPEISARVKKLLTRQNGKCKFCKLKFKDGDIWEVDHVLPTISGGKNVYSNLQLLHRHCHHAKSAKDGSKRYS
jgi:5-methylcytosine-specific restriction endonuclease McrA